MMSKTAETERDREENLFSTCDSTTTRQQRYFREPVTAGAAPELSERRKEHVATADDETTQQGAVTSAAVTGTLETAAAAAGRAIVSPPYSSQSSVPASSLTSPTGAAASKNQLPEAPTPSASRPLPAAAAASEAKRAALASTTTSRSQVSKEPSIAIPLRVGEKKTWRPATATNEDAVAAVEAAAAAAGIFPTTAEAAAADLDVYTLRSAPGNPSSCYAVPAAVTEQQHQPQQLIGGLARPLLLHHRDRGGRYGILSLENLNFVFKLAASALAALMLLLIFTHLGLLGPAVKVLLAKIQSLGVFSPFAFSIAYVLLVMCCVPAEPLHVAGGFIFVNLYGYKLGLPLALLCCTVSLLLASLGCFSLSRYAFSGGLHSVFINSEYYEAFCLAVEDGGTFFVALTRLSPLLPLAVTSYIFGLTPLSVYQLLVGSLSSVVLIFIFNCMGAALRDVDEIDISHIDLSSKKYLIAIFGLLMAFASVAYIGELTRRKLAQASEAAARRRMQEQLLLSNSVVGDVFNAA